MTHSHCTSTVHQATAEDPNDIDSGCKNMNDAKRAHTAQAHHPSPTSPEGLCDPSHGGTRLPAHRRTRATPGGGGALAHKTFSRMQRATIGMCTECRLRLAPGSCRPPPSEALLLEQAPPGTAAPALQNETGLASRTGCKTTPASDHMALRFCISSARGHVQHCL